MAYNYPYGNYSQLNLDWLLSAWREFQKAVEDMIAPQYSNSAAYPDHSLVIYNHVLYYNENEIPVAEEWDPNHWTEINLAQIVEEGGF